MLAPPAEIRTETIAPELSIAGEPSVRLFSCGVGEITAETPTAPFWISSIPEKLKLKMRSSSGNLASTPLGPELARTFHVGCAIRRVLR